MRYSVTGTGSKEKEKTMKTVLIRRLLISLAALVMIVGSVAVVTSSVFADHPGGGRPFTVNMTGAAEAPGPGDPDGSGVAKFTLNQGQGEICFEISVANIAPATAAHIHVAPAGSPGPVVVPLPAPTGGSVSGCVDVDAALIKAIRQHPENYYVNVHNAEFPPGAVRGQLSK
jgi:hypothetical protein